MAVNRSQAKIIRKWSRDGYCTLTLEAPAVAGPARPGQFIMVKVSDHGHPLLRRPFSLHARQGSNVSIFFQVTGLGTSLLARKAEGEEVDILGPLGQGFSVGEAGTKPALVGGGRGIAPLVFLADELRAAGVEPNVFYGGKTAADLPLREELERQGFDVFLSTDDGSLGFGGLVTELFGKRLDSFRPTRLFACGPEAMMENLSALSLREGIPAEFSLESVMGCGFGACWGCVKKIRHRGAAGWIKICQEGPVFAAEDIVWDGEERG